MSRARSTLLRPVDIAWLAAFRILYGVALCVSMVRFLAYGWVDRLFVQPRFYFKYWGFEWVEPLGRDSMHALFWVLAVLALAVALGFAFRLTAPLFALGLTYFQLIDVSTYLNHYYLASLLAFLLSASPAHRAWSVDAWLRRRTGRAQADELVSAGWLYLFRFQVGVVYTFAGVAKAQSDWLIHAQPLRIWLGANVDLPWVGPLFTLSFVPLLMSWLGFLFDTTIVAWLLWPKTRRWAYLVVIVFHTLTRVLFPIGMFPVIMTGAALVFFSPHWPRTLVAKLSKALLRLRGRQDATGSIAKVALPLRASQPVGALPRFHKLGMALGIGYCVLQLALPLRAFAYGGNVLWHEQGMRFSWRVMLRAKGGSTTYVVRNPSTGRTWEVNPRSYLTVMQESEMSGQPDLILQLAHHIRDDFEKRGRGAVTVHARSWVSLNGRRSAPFIDPEVDLTRIQDGLARADWILAAPGHPPPHTRPVL